MNSLTKIYSAAVAGIDAEIVEVEVDVLPGLPAVIIVGLPDTAVKEARERVKSAIKNSSAVFPPTRVAINLAPADTVKAGSLYDLPIALSILVNSGQIICDTQGQLFLGELALDGSVRPIPGVLPITLSARNRGFHTIFVPADNAKEASLVSGIKVIPVSSLSAAIAHLQGLSSIEAMPAREIESLLTKIEYSVDMQDIKGQDHAKRALEIAAAGGHNVLMSGSPGSGKTMLARTFATILPKMNEEEILEVTKIYSVSGNLGAKNSLVTSRPFRSPHHTASAISLVGGGSHPRPGEISLSHRGVLFLDELPEFGKHVLESLRQPLEDGIVTVSRASGTLTFPARFTLVAAQNPCPCGFTGDPVKACICSPTQVLRYTKRVSGPLLDRIDLHVDVPRITYEKIAKADENETSDDIRVRVENAREQQRQRYAADKHRIQTNAEMGQNEIKKYCELDGESKDLLRAAVSSMHLSARSYFRILKVARTIADLASEKTIVSSHISEALSYRPKDS